MRAAIGLLAAGLFVRLAWAETSGSRLAPSYSPASIVNSASNTAGALAPNTIATLYGAELSHVTRAIAPEDIRNGILPTVLTGSGVRVLINRLPANIYYVSPNQVNLLVPSPLPPGPAELQLILDGRAGPVAAITLTAAAPALYLQGPGVAVATRGDGTLASRQSPARPGEDIVLYATGFGETSPPLRYGEVPREPARLARMDQFRVLLDGSELAAEAVAYAGVTPGFAGLYQVNLKLPGKVAADPEIRLQFGEVVSPPGVVVAVRPE